MIWNSVLPQSPNKPLKGQSHHDGLRRTIQCFRLSAPASLRAPVRTLRQLSGSEELFRGVHRQITRQSLIGWKFQLNAAHASKHLHCLTIAGVLQVSGAETGVIWMTQVHEPAAPRVGVEIKRVLLVPRHAHMRKLPTW
jgi:hypothetical protein